MLSLFIFGDFRVHVYVSLRVKAEFCSSDGHIWTWNAPFMLCLYAGAPRLSVAWPDCVRGFRGAICGRVDLETGHQQQLEILFSFSKSLCIAQKFFANIGRYEYVVLL